MSRVAQHSGRAIALMMAGVCMLALMDVAFKLLVAHYSSMQVVFLRCAVSAAVFFVWILVTGRQQFKTAYPLGHLIRGIIGLGMLYTVGECFRELHLPDAYAIFFAAPLLITLLAGPVLGEPAGPLRILAAMAGFSGVLLVLKPTGAGWISYGGVMGLLAVVCYAATVMLLRRIGEKDNSVTIAFWFTALIGVGSAFVAIPGWRDVAAEHWTLVAVLGVSGTLGQVALTAAFRRAPVAVLAPFDYTHMIWAVIYSYLIWGFLPTGRTWVGASIVVASGLFVLYREQRAKRRAREAIGKA
ncbi:DMT family transporter [Elongatibacter sediminis]|uniref:DMT family transporter n=1 Tax=Elongatibacter sediminis TaxID=3119006 RepID=A0AAW9R9L4_9GAMM